MGTLSKQIWRMKILAGRGLQWLERYLPFGLRPSRAACHSFTYLFRDVADYQDLLTTCCQQARGPLEILSVGCATGQEPFSLAMLCAEAGTPCNITGIDLSAKAIAVAQTGRYDWEAEIDRAKADLAEDPVSGADVALKLLESCGKYFAPIIPGSRERVALPEIRGRVRFEIRDLCDLPFENCFDLILCRKMLYYLPAIKRAAGVAAMLQALKHDVPRSHLIFDGYTKKQPFFNELATTITTSAAHDTLTKASYEQRSSWCH